MLPEPLSWGGPGRASSDSLAPSVAVLILECIARGLHLKNTHCMRNFCFFFLALCPLVASAENPHWIWHDNHGKAIQTNEVRYFRKTFKAAGRITKVQLSVAADDEAVVYLNGTKIASPSGYQTPVQKEITDDVKRGENVIAIRGHNVGSDVAGVIVLLEIKSGKNSTYVVTDTSWLSSDREEKGWNELKFDDSQWRAAKDKGKHGDKPWGEVLTFPKPTPAEELTLLPGFKATLVHGSEIGEGSWICMTVDDQGRLIISPQADDQPLLRVTLARGGEMKSIEKISAPVRQAMGLLYANRSLYVNGHGPSGTGLYRLIDANHNGRFETNEVHFLKKFEGEGEHGYHAVNLGPDKMLYAMNGNHTKVPAGISTN